MNRKNWTYHNFKKPMRRDEAGHAGGGNITTTQNIDSNNSGGNAADSSGNANGADNSGQSMSAEQFWADPSSSSSTQSNTSQQNSNGNNDSSSVGQSIAQQLQAFRVGDFFSDDVASQIGEGNFQGANDRFNQFAQQTLRESIQMNATIMKAFGDNLMSRVEERLNSMLGNRDSSTALSDAFPAYKSDPSAKRTIDPIFEQAMKHTGNDRTKAIAMTRDMLRVMGRSLAGDMGLSNPGSSREDQLGDASQSLVDSLLTR